jgi:hypothetical protein
MPTGNPSALWATIFEIEPGLFQAIYSNTGSEVDESELPSYQTGAGIAEAKRRFEHSARALGYGTVTWVEVNTADLVFSGRAGLPLAAAPNLEPSYDVCRKTVRRVRRWQQGQRGRVQRDSGRNRSRLCSG